jgi:hypothetical protein
MSKKVSIKWQTSAAPVMIYAEATPDGSMVSVWTKNRNLGLYRMPRFGSKGLTASTLRNVLKGIDND